jgi:hypothetical protein
LEYLRQTLNSNHVHFYSKIKRLSSNYQHNNFFFIIRDNATLEIIENMMKVFNFEEDDPWKYDHFHVITDMRLIVGSMPYINYVDTRRERLANKEPWEKVEQLL